VVVRLNNLKSSADVAIILDSNNSTKVRSLNMPINARNKGKAGESEWINRYQPFFPDQLKRNLLQVREGGADISGCEPFQIEIKRCEKLEHPKWWRQVMAAVSGEEIPVVAFRQNHKEWRYLLPASLMIKDCEGYVEADENIFLKLVLETYRG
jgi:hypothetical protein